MRARCNWNAVGGLLLGIVGVVSYFSLVLLHNPRLRWLTDWPLLQLGAVALGIGLSLVGVGQAVQHTHRGRLLAPLLATLNVVLGGSFLWFLFVHTAHMPEAANAPALGAEAPDFTLRDQANHEVQLASLRGHPVVLLFYRGFW